MKKILLILFTAIIALGADAQKTFVRPPMGPRVFYSPHYRPYNINPYFGMNYGFYERPVYNNRPTKMERQIQDIENDYKDRINSVRADNSLTGHDRRLKIRELKHERNQAVADYKANYYKKFEN